jgi:hypothetical protein
MRHFSTHASVVGVWFGAGDSTGNAFGSAIHVRLQLGVY